MPETRICPECGDLAELVIYNVPEDDGNPRSIMVWECGQGTPPCEWAEDAEDYDEKGGRALAPLMGGSTCPVHTGTPEPCPTCGAYIAAGL